MRKARGTQHGASRTTPSPAVRASRIRFLLDMMKTARSRTLRSFQESRSLVRWLRSSRRRDGLAPVASDSRRYPRAFAVQSSHDAFPGMAIRRTPCLAPESGRSRALARGCNFPPRHRATENRFFARYNPKELAKLASKQ